MSKKEKNEKIDNNETHLDVIEPKLEESEEYHKASFGEKISLKFRKKLIANRIYTLILIALITSIIIVINIWADSKNLAQIDVTKNHLYSLTQTSKDQLKNLNKEVKIYVYGYTKEEDLVQFLQQYNAFQKNISYEIISESTNYELVTKYELGSTNAIVVACGDKDTIIYPEYEFSASDSASGDTVNLAEEKITNAILRVSTDDPVKVYFASGNGEYSLESLYSLDSYLKVEVYETEELNLMSITEIPEDCDILAILSPEEDITESQAELIKGYINKGGNLLICSLKQKDKEFVNLQSVLDMYGVSINDGLLYESDGNHFLAYQNSRILPHILFPDCSSSNKITSDFSRSNSNQNVVMPWSQSLTINDVEEENVKVDRSDILTTSSSCYNVVDYDKGITEETISDLEKGQYTIGSELTRTIGADDSKIESKLVIYANTSFFLDSYKDGYIQLNAINNLSLNTFAELGEKEDLITIRKATNSKEFKNSELEARVVKLIIFGVPVLIIVLGIIIWNYRRKKR